MSARTGGGRDSDQITESELALRRAIFESFATNGSPPTVKDSEALRGLALRHIVVLGSAGEIWAAHPFAGHHGGASVRAGERTWWGSCAWDALGIVAALQLRDARIASNGIEIELMDGRLESEAVFHVSVPARHWWDDIAFT